MTSRKTPFFECYADHGARLTDFAGWSLPVQFGAGVMAEHVAVRTRAGLFDVSHMARFEVRGAGSEAYLDGLLSNNVRKLVPGQMFYTVICREDGGVIDDLVVYRFDDHYLIVANAANRAPVWSWLQAHAGDDVTLVDRSDDLGHLALQGPKSQEILGRLLEADLDAIGYYRFQELSWGDTPLLVSRNGYTGEDGFELYPPTDRAPDFWRALFEVGRDVLSPVGLGARDTLRLEVAYPLYGHELGLDTTPIEAGLAWVVKTKKRSFVGADVLRRQKKEGISRTLVGFEFEGRLIGRQGAPIQLDGAEIGRITSGTFGPSVEKGIALGFVPPAQAEVGTELTVEVRGRSVPARVVSLPFYTDGTHR